MRKGVLHMGILEPIMGLSIDSHQIITLSRQPSNYIGLNLRRRILGKT